MGRADDLDGIGGSAMDFEKLVGDSVGNYECFFGEVLDDSCGVVAQANNGVDAADGAAFHPCGDSGPA